MEQVFEDVASNGNKLVIDRNRRCVRCNAYMVLEEVKPFLYTENLKTIILSGKEVFVCSDEKECARNKFNQETMVTIITEETPGNRPEITGYQMFAPDGESLEVYKSDGQAK